MIRNTNVFIRVRFFFTEALQRYHLKLFSQNLTLVLRFIITNWQIQSYYHLKNTVYRLTCAVWEVFMFLDNIKVKFNLHIWKIKSFLAKIWIQNIFLSYAFLFINLGIRIFFSRKIAFSIWTYNFILDINKTLL